MSIIRSYKGSYYYIRRWFGVAKPHAGQLEPVTEERYEKFKTEGLSSWEFSDPQGNTHKVVEFYL